MVPIPAGHRAAWASRIPLLRAVLLDERRDSGPDDRHAAGGLPNALRDVVDPCNRAHVWLTLAVLTGRLPDRTTVVEVARADEFDGGLSCGGRSST